MGRTRKGPVPPLGVLREKFENAYADWNKWPQYHSDVHYHLLARGPLRHQGSIDRDFFSRHLPKEVKTAFERLENAIFRLIERSKSDLYNPRIKERFAQAERVGDKQFFDALGNALKKNVGRHKKFSERIDIAVLDSCAFEYLSGNRRFIRQEYKHWEKFDIEEERRRTPDDQRRVDRLEAIKNAVTQEGGLEEFRKRVKAVAEHYRRGEGIIVGETRVNFGGTGRLTRPKQPKHRISRQKKQGAIYFFCTMYRNPINELSFAPCSSL